MLGIKIKRKHILSLLAEKSDLDNDIYHVKLYDDIVAWNGETYNKLAVDRLTNYQFRFSYNENIRIGLINDKYLIYLTIKI